MEMYAWAALPGVQQMFHPEGLALLVQLLS
jgi:hypothetical protein